MKRRLLLKHLRKEGCLKRREGRKHTMYWNPSNHNTSVIPRHTEVDDRLARKICSDLGIAPP